MTHSKYLARALSGNRIKNVNTPVYGHIVEGTEINSDYKNRESRRKEFIRGGTLKRGFMRCDGNGHLIIG